MIDCGFEDLHIDSFLEQLEQEAFEKAIPLSGVFELTPRCNMDCQMCYVHLKPEQIPEIGRELTSEEWIDLANQAREMGMVKLILTGGEVFVRKDFRKIYEALCEMGFLIQVYTNGYALDRETVDWLAQRPPYALRFSVYGFSDETYEKVCRVRDGFTRTMEAIRMARSAGIFTYIVSTVTKDNEADLPQIAAFARENQIPFTYTAELVNPVRGATADVNKYRISHGIPDKETIRQIRSRAQNNFPRRTVDNLLDVCGSYRKGFWITWNGNMQLCAFLTEPARPVLKEGFQSAWNGLLSDLLELKPPEKCSSCKYEQYCLRCYGSLYAETGRCDVPAQSCCDGALFRYSVFGPEND